MVGGLAFVHMSTLPRVFQMTEENKWPILDTYEDCWPVRSMLKLALKSSAEASRRAAIKNTNEHLRATLTGQINVAQKVKAREVHN